MSDQPPTNPVFGFRLLETCMLGTLAGEERKRRLQMCLKCLLYWAREFNRNSAPLPSYFPLPDLDMARRLQAEQDPTSTMMGRCFGALIAKKLAADINSCHSSGVRGREAKLVSLSAILGRDRASGEVENFLGQPGAIGLANIVSLMASSEMNTFITEKAPLEALDVFQETVNILLAKDFLTSLGAGLPQGLVDSFHGIYSNARRLQAPEWLMVGLGEIEKRFPAVKLDDDRVFEDLVARRVPGFFDSDLISHAPSVILSLIDDQSSQSDQFDPVLGSRIDDLLNMCVPGTCYSAFMQKQTACLLFPHHLREPEMTRQIRSEVDIAARLIGRSFGALVVTKLAQDIGSRTDRAPRVNDSEAELSCLAAILGTTNAEVATLLSQPGAIGLTNIVSLMSSHLGRWTSVVGSSGHIPNDAHHGGPSGFTEYRAATRSSSHFSRDVFQPIAILSS
ncbi:hypothetical protein EDB85DRAFT_2198670 [Lactarius pseudohatsudake]|nr:hypothetical protein EDB85DRAFT_2198670 [Lactarius pseudohatsudake]